MSIICSLCRNSWENKIFFKFTGKNAYLSTASIKIRCPVVGWAMGTTSTENQFHKFEWHANAYPYCIRHFNTKVSYKIQATPEHAHCTVITHQNSETETINFISYCGRVPSFCSFFKNYYSIRCVYHSITIRNPCRRCDVKLFHRMFHVLALQIQ